MSNTVLVVFLLVYLGMFLGELPFLQIDRTGIALLGAIALVALGEVSPERAALSVHLPTILLLFSFMVLSAQMRLGGFYGRVTRIIAASPVGRRRCWHSSSPLLRRSRRCSPTTSSVSPWRRYWRMLASGGA